MKRQFAFSIVSAILLGLLAGCSNAEQPDAPDDPSVLQDDTSMSNGETIYLEVSWAMGYDDLDSLTRDAVLVVEGHVTRQTNTSTETAEAGDVSGTLVFSDFEFEVDETLKGSESSSSITLHQTGGTVNDRSMEVRDDPLIEVGERYILFLLEDPNASGTFYVLGGPAGRLVVDQGVVQSLSMIYPERGIDDLGTTDIGVEEFSTDIREAALATR